jgi:hypothetical protein
VLIGLPYFPDRATAERSLARLSIMNRLTISGSKLAPMMCYMKDLLALPVFAPLLRVPVDLYRDYWKHTWISVSRSLFNGLLAADVTGVLSVDDRSRSVHVHGKAEPAAPISHIQALVQRFPDLTLHELNGTHHLYLTYPGLVNRLIIGEARPPRRA